MTVQSRDPMSGLERRPCGTTTHCGATVIEPAEPETPPAHSLGKVLWRGTGGEGGGKTCFFIAFFIWRGWWLDLFFHRFFDIFGRLGQEKSTEIAAKVKIDEKTEKYQKNDQKVGCLLSVLEPKMDPKWTKNRPGAEKVRPEAAPEAIFIVVCCRRCSESLPEPILGGSDPSKLYYYYSGSTILTKSPFSKKHRKSSLRGPVLGPK